MSADPAVGGRVRRRPRAWSSLYVEVLPVATAGSLMLALELERRLGSRSLSDSLLPRWPVLGSRGRELIISIVSCSLLLFENLRVPAMSCFPVRTGVCNELILKNKFLAVYGCISTNISLVEFFSHVHRLLFLGPSVGAHLAGVPHDV